jgi:hypothetical protein
MVSVSVPAINTFLHGARNILFKRQKFRWWLVSIGSGVAEYLSVMFFTVSLLRFCQPSAGSGDGICPCSALLPFISPNRGTAAGPEAHFYSYSDYDPFGAVRAPLDLIARVLPKDSGYRHLWRGLYLRPKACFSPPLRMIILTLQLSDK